MITGKTKVGEISISAVVTRADGTKVDLGKVHSSKWKGRFSPGRLYSIYRINRANRSMTVGN